MTLITSAVVCILILIFGLFILSLIMRMFGKELDLGGLLGK